MLWVERNLRRKSSKVWCEDGLDAHFNVYKAFMYTVLQKNVYIKALLFL